MVTAELAIVDSTSIAKKGAAPGKAIVAKSVGLGGGVTTAEMYQAPGLVSRPAKNARHVVLPVGSGRRYMLSIACHNYDVNVEVSEGETAIYSTTADGKTVKAQVILGADGKIVVKNETKSLKTILENIVTHLRDLTTTNCVVGSPVTLAPATITNLSADLLDLATLLEE